MVIKLWLLLRNIWGNTKLVEFEIRSKGKKYFYVIIDSDKIIFISKLYNNKYDAEKDGERRTNLYDVQHKIIFKEGV